MNLDGGFNTRLFCFFKLFLMVGKGLSILFSNYIHTLVPLITSTMSNSESHTTMHACSTKSNCFVNNHCAYNDKGWGHFSAPICQHSVVYSRNVAVLQFSVGTYKCHVCTCTSVGPSIKLSRSSATSEI